ncbi:MAG TPA: phospholipase [Solirubrobacteraceae bacterium]|nr:phospholipase [Solirubrobacteraceae bacterium]
MTTALPDTLVHRVRPAAGAPQGALVLMHGRGTDETDLLGFLDLLDPRRRLLGITPGGPLHLPPGGRHWYIVQRVGYPDPGTFAAGYATLSAFVDAIPQAAGVPWDRIVLGGFSQGAVMAYALGLGPGRPRPAAIIAMSGFVPAVHGWVPDLDARRGLPVWIAHGRRDPVIGVEFGRAARDLLSAGDLEVTYDESDAAHHVDPRALAALPAWIERVVPPTA